MITDPLASRKMYGVWCDRHDTPAESYLSVISSSAGSVAAAVANRKELKYQSLTRSPTCIPLAFETFGPVSWKGVAFFT